MECANERIQKSELWFLHDRRVPSNNSLCERLARVYKRKQKQAMALRSQENLGYICDSLSTVYLLRIRYLPLRFFRTRRSIFSITIYQNSLLLSLDFKVICFKIRDGISGEILIVISLLLIEIQKLR